MRRNAIAWTALVVSTAALVSSRGLTRPVPAAPRIPVESQRTARSLSDAFVAVADFVRPSVVQIHVERKIGSTMRLPNGQGRRGPGPQGPGGNLDPKEFNDLLRDMMKRFNAPEFEPQQEQFGGGVARGTGSGFIYDDKGHILTNNHVVDGAGKIMVTFHDGVEVPAKVVGTDSKSDVAVIKVEHTDYPVLPRGASGKLRVGELVMAVGSPFGLSQSVTMGIVSATERNNLGINEGMDSYESFIQTDAPINPGNSGGPLVDMDGRVVGINSAIMSGGRAGYGGGNDGVGFAIPIDLASQVAEHLIKDGKVNRARIGVGIKPLTPVEAKALGIDPKTKGALVEMVVPGSPADKAGLKSGDVIVGFNGKPIANTNAFRMNVAASQIGKPYNLTYYRDGREHSTQVVLSSSEQVVFDQEKESAGSHGTTPEVPKTAINDFGLEVQPLTPELARGLGIKETSGLLISSVKEGSPAEAKELKPGMVITQVVKDKRIQAVGSVKDFQALAASSHDLMFYVKSNDIPSGGAFVTLSKSKD